jgi:CheY-like chemotaxis protein
MAARKVLVIDDSATIHKVIDHTLKRLGYEVTFVRDGEAGIAKAKELKPDLVLLDFMMPGMNGYQVCKELGQSDDFEDIPIVLMSAKGEMIGEKLVKTMGIVDFITKPFSPEALSALTQHTIDKYNSEKPSESDKSELLMKVGQRTPEDLPSQADLSDPSGQPAIRGNLGMIPAGEVFQLLKFQAHTGILHMARGEAHLEVFMREGTIAYARARNVDEEFLLGRFLIEVEAISSRDLEVFLESRRGSNKLLGEQLVKLGHLTAEQLAKAIEKQTEAMIYEVLRWGEGEFAFYVSEKLPPEAREAGLRIPIDLILMEGFRRVDEWGLIEKEIHDFDRVLSPTRDNTGVMKHVELKPEEERILALVDGRRTVKDIIRASRRSSFDVCMLLYRLLSSRIIRKRSSQDPTGR